MKATTILAGVGGLAVLLFMSNTFGAQPAQVSPPTPTPPTPKKPTAAVAASVPLTIVKNSVATKNVDNMYAQSVWLVDNGYPKTGASLRAYADGDTSLTNLLVVAAAEKKVASAPRKGSTEVDVYGMALIGTGSDDEVYSLAITSLSIPFVKAAADRLASRGDSRAMDLTSHLADIS